MKLIGYVIIGAVIGLFLLIIISVLVISGRQSDEEYRRELREAGIDIDKDEPEE